MNDMFEMYKEQMSCQIVAGVFDKSMCPVDEFAALEPLCMIPPDICTGNPNPADSNVNQPISRADDAPEVPMEAEVEPDREPDMFDNPEEYVGYDDEGMYMPIPPTQPPSSSQPHSNSPPPYSHNAEMIMLILFMLRQRSLMQTLKRYMPSITQKIPRL